MRDEQLIKAIRTGDKRASERLARRYHSDLYAYFCSRIGREGADDLTQVTLLHTVARIDRFREESSFRHYVFSVARRVLFERHRRGMRRLDTDEPRSEPPAVQTSPTERVFRAEFREQLEAAISTLNAHYRVVVFLYLHGANNFEISEALNLEYNTVRSRLSRGLGMIRDLLSPWALDKLSADNMPGELEPPSPERQIC